MVAGPCQQCPAPTICGHITIAVERGQAAVAINIKGIDATACAAAAVQDGFAIRIADNLGAWRW
ncbi:MAG: hypothetical protein Alpg2KO_33060 [Alphaproteobacteria bacterium]